MVSNPAIILGANFLAQGKFFGLRSDRMSSNSNNVAAKRKISATSNVIIPSLYRIKT